MALGKVTGAACALMMTAGAVSAVEMVGGEIDLSYSRFLDQFAVDTDGEEETFSKLTLGGQIEIGVVPMFSVQGDLAYHDYDAIDDDANTATLHAILHYDDYLSFGAFIGRDSALDGDLDFFGVETAYARDLVSVEAYVSNGEIDDLISGELYGISVAYEVRPDFKVGVKFDQLEVDGGLDLSRFGLTADYEYGPGRSFYAEVGSAEAEFADLSEDESYVEVGARFAFGQDGGATFSTRGLADLIPGL